ncbi:MAG: hypothetical protein MUF59_05100 [Candidatus Krumholzibacteria bacterium]|nr:hypothetical protein [Candidatus Krumholzibacteria bacterium]
MIFCCAAVIALSGRASNAFEHQDSRASGMGGTVMPGGIHPCCAMAWEDRYAAVAASRSAPYSIQGLAASKVALDIHGEGKWLSASWGALGHDLYREDRFSIETALVVAGRFLAIGCRGEMTRRKVEGATAEREALTAAAVEIFFKGGLALQVDRPILRGARGGGDDFRVRAAVVAGGLRLSFNRIISIDGYAENRFGASIPAAAGASLLLGYRPGTEIISAGLHSSGKNLNICFSWESHPVLGNTFSALVERIWR